MPLPPHVATLSLLYPLLFVRQRRIFALQASIAPLFWTLPPRRQRGGRLRTNTNADSAVNSFLSTWMGAWSRIVGLTYYIRPPSSALHAGVLCCRTYGGETQGSLLHGSKGCPTPCVRS